MAYIVSENFNKVLYSEDLQYDCILEINGTRVPIEQIKKIENSSPIIDTTNETGKLFHLGTFISNQITITFKNLDGLKLDNKPNVHLEIGLKTENGEYEYVPIGEFLIDDLAENYHETCQITCLDYAIKMKTSIDISQFFNEEGYITAENLFKSLCNYYGVEAGNYPETNKNKKIYQYDSTLSGKSYISYLAELMGGNAKFGRNNKLNIIPLNQKEIPTLDLTYNPESKNKLDNSRSIPNVALKWGDGQTFNEAGSITSDYIDIKLNTQYSQNYSAQVLMYDTNKNFIAPLEINIGFYSFIITNENCAYIKLGYRKVFNNNIDMTTVKDIMLNEGTTLLPYTPYDPHGNQYYIDGESTQKTRSGKNIFDIENWYNTISFASAVKHSMTNKVITMNGTENINSYFLSTKNWNLKPNTKYTLSIDCMRTGTSFGCYFNLRNTTSHDDQTYGKISPEVNRKRLSKTFTTDNSGNFYLSGYVNYPGQTEAVTLTIYSMQLEEGVEETEYEEYGVMPSPEFPSPIVNTYKAGTYKTNIENKWYYITIPQDLRSVPNVADRLWLDIVNNKVEIEKKINSIILDGSENYSMIGGGVSGATNYYFVEQTKTPQTGVPNCPVSSNYFENKTIYGVDTVGIKYEGAVSDNSIRIRTSQKSVVDFKQWLSTHNTEVQYQLANVETVKGEIEQLDDFNKPYEPIKINSTTSKSFNIGDSYEISRVVYDDGKIKYEFGANVITVDELPITDIDENVYYYLTTDLQYYKYNIETNKLEINTEIKNTLQIRLDNLLISKEEEVENIYNSLKGFKIWNITCERPGNISLDSWDIIKYVVDDKMYYTINNHSFSYNGAIRDKLETKIPTGTKAETTNIYNNSIDNKIYRLKTTIDEENGEIRTEVSKKVGNDEIISKINQSAEKIQISGDKIDINGKAVNFTTGIEEEIGPFTQEDVNKIVKYLSDEIDLTPEEFKMYDVTDDGIINSADLLYVQRAVINGGKIIISGNFKIDPYSMTKSISLERDGRNLMILSLLQNYFKKLDVDEINVSNNLNLGTNCEILKEGEDITQKHIITLGNNTNAILIKDTQSNIPLETTVAKVGLKLAKVGNGVMVEGGVSHVKVSATMWIQVVEGYKWLYILQNDTRVATAIQPSNLNQSWESVTISPRLITVNPGDVISLAGTVTTNNGTTGGYDYGDASCYLTVEVVD